MPADGGKSIQITKHPTPDSEPTWSFDGKWIAFITREAGRMKFGQPGFPRMAS